MKAQRGVRRFRVISSLVPIALLLAMAIPGQASAATSADVAVQDDFFTPGTVTITYGGTVNWKWDGTTNDGHTATDNTGMNLYDSHIQPPGTTTTFPFVFYAAGTYPFHCTVHFGMKGTAKVKPKASPKSGATTDTYKISWSTQAAPSGFNYDVQKKGPADSGWVNLRVNLTAQSLKFVPDQGPGTYQFRVRLQKGTGSASGYSPLVKITVS